MLSGNMSMDELELERKYLIKKIVEHRSYKLRCHTNGTVNHLQFLFFLSRFALFSSSS
jgi:hypothetical protein